MKNYKKYLVYTLMLFIYSCNKNVESHKKNTTDNFYEKCRKLVLSEDKIGQEYNFSVVGNEIDDIHIKYIGNIITSKHDTLKIVNSQNVFGYLKESKKGNGSIYIYKSKNQLEGFYFVGDYWGCHHILKNKI